jgi:GNAT superfamily N-acetyltransferase
MPSDYVKMMSSARIFIVEESNHKAGFFTLKKVGHKAEIQLIYFDAGVINKGFGSKSMEFIENWIKENWQTTTHIFLDTIIPKYNGGFYEKMGYTNLGISNCSFSGKHVAAIRFEKKL